MPSPRILDFGPETQPDPLANIIGQFAKRTRENQIQEDEATELDRIYKGYLQDGKDIEKAVFETQKSRLSPTAKVNAVNSLIKLKDQNIELQKIAATQKKDEQKKLEEQQQDIRNRELLKNAGASEKDIQLYEAAPVGGRTKVIGDIIEKNSRLKTPDGFVSQDIEDFDRGLTPSERVRRQDDRYKIQTPLINKNSESLFGLENEGMSIQLLNELNDSGRVGQGIRNININPETGALVIPKLGTPEEQLFVKTVNDFTVKAKNSFGARVTNFELDRFMQRLPTLANSEEGRRLILRQMNIINQIDQLEKKALQGVFDQYGIRNIDYADAENKARSQISDQKEQLRKEYLNLEQIAKTEESTNISQLKSKAPEGYILMRKPDGTLKYFPEKNRPNLEDKGYKPL